MHDSPAPSSSTADPATRRARAAGWIALVLAACALAAVTAFVIREARAPGHAVSVAFPALGTLMPGDPVLEAGVPVGRVQAIAAHPGDRNRAVVLLRMDRHHAMPPGTRFVNQPRSLMGARAVWIERASDPHGTAASLIPSQEDVRAGEYVPGLPELLHAAVKLPALVRALQEELDAAVDAGSGGPLAAAFTAGDAVQAVTLRLEALARALDTAGGTVRSGIARAASAGQALAAGADAAGPAAETFTDGAGRALARLDHLAAALEHALAATETSLDAARARVHAVDPSGDRTHYDALAGHARALDSLLRRLRTEGLGDAATVRPRM